jgi:dTDP-4-dehydrorhamnose reductase
MRILLLGKLGQLGWELHRALSPLGEIVALDYPDIDLAHAESLPQLLKDTQPEVIVNATAYNAVDRAESEPEIAYAVNARAPGLLAEHARKLGAALIHYSTDYVFDGAKDSPYLETDTPNPLGVYGQSKLDGEMAIEGAGGVYLILRTSWVYSLRRPSFVTKVLDWSRQQSTLRVVSDQVSNPTWARMLAETTALLLAKGTPDILGYLEGNRGIYHLAGSGHASRFEWAQAILNHDPKPDEQVTREVLPAKSSDFPTPATRPLFSALNCEHFSDTFGLRMPDWEEALNMAMSDSI